VSPGAVIYLLWGVGFFGWVLGAILGRREAGALSGWLSFFYHVIAIVAVVMVLTLARPFPGIDLQYPLWPRCVPDELGWALAVLVFAGFGFAAWGSIHRIARQSHGATLIDTGPYAVVRHPVYFGLAIAALATAVSAGQLTAFLGAGLLIVAELAKVMFEEHATDDDAHRAYRHKVPLFLPFWPKRD
jgi:protein-S-isoprenylcysteine O-methyltransferase Ste14